MKKKNFTFILLNILVISIPLRVLSADVNVSGEFKKWHTITLMFDGPITSEMDEYNPFVNYRLNVLFTHGVTRKSYLVPGYFAADGNAANTSASKGNKWCVHFTPDEIGEWNYSVQFRKGNWVAISDRDLPGESGKFMDGKKGSFIVERTDKTGRDFRGRGRLQYVGGRYLKLAETGEYFLKIGTDAPENFLSYVDFDGTFHNDGHKDNLVKLWEAHRKDWRKGDPVWKDGKGKAIIGAINYLESKELNSVSFLTMNIKGDDQNVFPFVDYDTYDRYDISKLAQWDIVFKHAQEKGIFLHFKTQESENQGLLDNGGVGLQRKVYYRELIARFGYHLALNWNMGEEDGDWIKNHQTPPQFKWQRLAMASYFEEHDPYQHHRVIHNGEAFDDLLGPNTPYTGQSLQTTHKDFRLVHKEVLKWLDLSVAAGKPWAIACDEPGDAQLSLTPDSYDTDKRDARVNALWGTLLAGGWGVEWYFGYKLEQSDITCEDYRSRDLFWNQCAIALNFFKDNEIPFWEMKCYDELMMNGTDFCFGKKNQLYVIMLKNGGNEKINLKKQDANFKVYWFNPRTGGSLKRGDIKSIRGGKIIEIGYPPNSKNKDWIVLLKG